MANPIYLVSKDPATNKIRVSDLPEGTGGIEMQNDGNFIQWRNIGDTNWTNLLSVESLQGEPGEVVTVDARRFWNASTQTWSPRPAVSNPVFSYSLDDASAPPPPDSQPRDVWIMAEGA